MRRSKLPLIAPPLVREHRLYQADWLLRFYGFQSRTSSQRRTRPNLDLAIDPKLAWALRNRHVFPLDLNKAPRELLLRVPGVGTKSVERILQVATLAQDCGSTTCRDCTQHEKGAAVCRRGGSQPCGPHG